MFNHENIIFKCKKQASLFSHSLLSLSYQTTLKIYYISHLFLSTQFISSLSLSSLFLFLTKHTLKGDASTGRRQWHLKRARHPKQSHWAGQSYCCVSVHVYLSQHMAPRVRQ